MKQLLEFVQNKMRMSHIYQPVMIKALIDNGGKCSKTTIAEEILRYDYSQVEYYENVTNNMVGRVLRNHKLVEKHGDDYVLAEYDNLDGDEKEVLVKICDQKIAEYIDNRGNQIWEHRRKNRKAVSGSIRYNVLKRAYNKCELCGISSSEKALEVDHIVPKNLGGEDSINNYQALCYTCNANKRDTDSTDFRNVDKFYKLRDKECVFCSLDQSRIIDQNNLAIAFYDKYPVTELHSLIIPKRHCSNYFDLTQAEINAVNQLVSTIKNKIQERDSTVQGYNIGINNGEVAGQTIFHCHIHLIPRRSNDVEYHIGGVRNIISGKGDYINGKS